MGFYLAIDIGTESARASVFSDAGERLGEASQPFATSYPRPGWAEQDPREWWRCTAAATRAALAQAGTDRVDTVGVATTASTVVVLDAAGEPLRPAILWMDNRAAAESAETGRSDHPVLAHAGGGDSAEWLVPKAMWLARHEPEVYRASARIGEAVDYLTLKLTGEWLGSQLNAVCKWNHDPVSGRLPGDLYETWGIGDLVDRLPGTIRPAGTPAAPLSSTAAAELGLREGAIVITGGIDAHLALITLRGASEHPVAVAAGTSNAFIAELDHPVHAESIWGPYPDALTPGRWLVEGGQISAGAALSWLSERVLGVDRADLPGLWEQAAAVPPAGHGLLVLDHFMGNRTPLKDPTLRGAILGLSLGTTPAELYRATVEAVAHGTRQVLESFTQVGVDTSEVFFTGGIRHNPLWLQTTADALGRPINLVDGENLTTRAVAILGTAAHTGESVDAVSRRFTPAHTVIAPDSEASAALAEAHEEYLAATALLAPLGRRLAEASRRERS